MSSFTPDWQNDPDSHDGGRGPTDIFGNSKLTSWGTPNIHYRDDMPSCFDGSTPIDTAHGPAPISQIQPGQMILSWDDAAKEMVLRPVQKLIEAGHASVVALKHTASQTPLLVTPHHTMLMQQGWRTVAKIKPGDQIMAIQNGVLVPSEIESLDKLDGKRPVFNLHTKGEHNFIAGGLVAHNFTVLRPLRTAIAQTIEKMGDALRGRKAPKPVFVLGS